LFKMKVAVTGASGFIGRHVIEELVHTPVEIIAITRDAARLIDIKNKVNIIELDIAHPPSNCYEALKRPEILIHLAWGGLPNYQSPSHSEEELPRQGIFLEKLIRSGLPSLLVAGTCLEYGLQSGPLSEDALPAPVCAYGQAKNYLRQQLEDLKNKYAFNLTWARLFYTYGNGQSENSLFPGLKEAVLRRDRVFNMSGGEQIRDYLPVNSVAEYIVKLALLNADIGVINICSGQPISIRSLVENWLNEYRWNIKLNLGYYAYPDYEPMAFWGDRHKLARWLAQPESS
jgi:nucleoside-diphosphate-sugar epimerase